MEINETISPFGDMTAGTGKHVLGFPGPPCRVMARFPQLNVGLGILSLPEWRSDRETSQLLLAGPW